MVEKKIRNSTSCILWRSTCV